MEKRYALGLEDSLNFLFDEHDLPVQRKKKSSFSNNFAPLSERIRPEEFTQMVGQTAVLGDDGVVARIMRQKPLPNVILWGPPGCGKTTLARLMAGKSGAEFETISAVSAQIAEIKKIFTHALERKRIGQSTVLLVDEIHRLNRAQQDVFLPVMEDGTITLIGATTENPSFELNAALLSRARVIVMQRLEDAALEALLLRVEEHKQKTLPLDSDARILLRALADGDGRHLVQLCEEIYAAEITVVLSEKELLGLVSKRRPVYDKHQDGHYNLISAVHKSLRGSDVDAALYWTSRMLEAGEDPLYLLRRLVRFASEDIGMADPQALVQALSAMQSFEMLGTPEGELAIAQAVIYLATAPKSNALYVAYKAARLEAQKTGSLMPPKHILNAPTDLMRKEGYGSGYIYDHDTADGFSGQNYFPQEMQRKVFYQPVERGFERSVKERLAYWSKLRAEKTGAG